MLVCRTPFRISFFGGGTDYPSWYKEHGGAVICSTINKYSYITARWLPPFFKYKHRIRYYKQEEVNKLEEIEHPTVRESALYLGIERGIEIVHNADLPARSGLGSSSTFTVGLLHSLHALQDYMPTKRELAEQAIHIEQERVRENVGSQDQIAAAFGGLNIIRFSRNGDFYADPIVTSQERLSELQSSLVLCFTGFARNASHVAEKQLQQMTRMESCYEYMQTLCDEALSVLCSKSETLLTFGKLLNEQWRIKRSLSDAISSPSIDSLYETGITAGAVGGKLLGAGGGGFMLFFVPKGKREQVVSALSDKLVVPFRFDSLGSRLIYHTHES